MHTAAAHATQGEGANDTGAASHLDRSGRQRIGKASFYAERYSGRTMADGTPMRPSSNNAASLTLPLGTTARVTNLETGKSAIITIRDRGPYVKGRIVDLSPTTATLIGISQRQGLALVAVTPIALPALQTRGKSRLSARLAS
jgi:rare lipoprotein A